VQAKETNKINTKRSINYDIVELESLTN